MQERERILNGRSPSEALRKLESLESEINKQWRQKNKEWVDRKAEYEYALKNNPPASKYSLDKAKAALDEVISKLEEVRRKIKIIKLANQPLNWNNNSNKNFIEASADQADRFYLKRLAFSKETLKNTLKGTRSGNYGIDCVNPKPNSSFVNKYKNIVNNVETTFSVAAGIGTIALLALESPALIIALGVDALGVTAGLGSVRNLIFGELDDYRREHEKQRESSTLHSTLGLYNFKKCASSTCNLESEQPRCFEDLKEADKNSFVTKNLNRPECRPILALFI